MQRIHPPKNSRSIKNIFADGIPMYEAHLPPEIEIKTE
jgi:hypothetical protein